MEIHKTNRVMTGNIKHLFKGSFLPDALRTAVFGKQAQVKHITNEGII